MSCFLGLTSISTEDTDDFNEISRKLLAHCREAGDNGPFDKDALVAGIVGVAGSLLKSAGVLVPGAGLVVDLCRWVGERAKAVKEGQESAAKLDKEVVLASKNLRRRLGILEKCERAIATMVAKSETNADLDDAINDFHDLLPGTWATLTRAGQVSNMACKGRGVKKNLRLFFGAKTVSACVLTLEGCLHSTLRFMAIVKHRDRQRPT